MLAADDGLPVCDLTVLWSQVSGPGSVAFSNPDSQSTAATFSEPGTYVLRCLTDDGALTGSDDVTIVVVR